MTDNRPASHYYVVAMRIKFRSQDLNIGNAELPEGAQHIFDEHVLDDSFAKGRVYEVTIFPPA